MRKGLTAGFLQTDFDNYLTHVERDLKKIGMQHGELAEAQFSRFVLRVDASTSRPGEQQ